MSTEAAAPAAPVQPGAPAPTNAAPQPPKPTDPAAPPPTEPPKEEEGFAKRFAALTRKERAFQEQQKALKSERESPEYKEFLDYKKAKATAVDDPTEYLKAHGWDYAKLTDFYINDKKPTTEDKLERIQKRLDDEARGKADEAKKREEDAKAAQATQVEETITAHKAAIADAVAKNAETFELIAAQGEDGPELVWEIIEAQHEKTGEILPIEKACQAAEDWLEEQVRAKILKTKKFQPKQEPTAVTPTPGATPKTYGSPPTLTNSVVAAAPPVESSQNLSADELRKRAVASLRWK